MQRIYLRILHRWIGNYIPGPSLKTDLYDEAVTKHNILPILSQRSGCSIGMDITAEVAAKAKYKLRQQGQDQSGIVVCDTRKMAFKTASYGSIFSNSTLDHFSDIKDIQISMKELFRVLKPHGTLILTMDNPQNPIIRLRNLLPFRAAKAMGLIPFYMGKTLNRSALIQLLESVGFKVQAVTAVVHSPRFFALQYERLLSRGIGNKLQKLILKILLNCELLETMPSRYITGHFVAVMARKEPV